MGGGGGEPPPWDGASKDMSKSSTFGKQFSSARRGAPAYGFSAATREVANKVFVSQEHTALATAGMHSPGPASYLLPPSVGGKQPDGRRRDAPSFGFGSAPRFMTEKVSARTPGPGAGGHQPAIGPQVNARFRSEPSAGFGKGNRDVAKKVFISQEHSNQDMYGMGSPGPATIALESTLGKQASSAFANPSAWVFSTAGRDDIRTKQKLKEAKNSPGPPGLDQLRASVGPQVSSRFRTQPIAGFGTSKVATQNKLYVSKQHDKMHFGKDSPGPLAKYEIGPSVGRQFHSKDSSQPAWGFGSQDRWHTYNKELKANTTPGPGAYDPAA